MSLVTDADLEKLLASLYRIPIKGKINLSAAVNVAMVRDGISPLFNLPGLVLLCATSILLRCWYSK
jgi:hypothetical protein